MINQIFNTLNSETINHSKKVAIITEILVKYANENSKIFKNYAFTSPEVAYECGLWHDVGKADKGVLSAISANRALTPDERVLVNQHPALALAFIDSFYTGKNKEIVMEVALLHHRKADNTGTPDIPVPKSLPVLVQLVSIADCFEALSAKRSYKNSMSYEEAKAKVFNGLCGYFTPQVKFIFDKAFDEIVIALS